jgi:hypothetical protein
VEELLVALGNNVIPYFRLVSKLLPNYFLLLVR